MAGGRLPAEKGRKAEVEVVALWRANGWPRARRQPGSGSWRPYGPRDSSPMPLDVGGVDPFLVSVKRDKLLARPQMRTRIPGGAFARRALLEVELIAGRKPVGGPARVPVLFGRPGQGEGPNGWRVWAPEWFLALRLHAEGSGIYGAFLELPWWAFFPLIGTAEDWRSEVA
jgi:hypothetical protein